MIPFESRGSSHCRITDEFVVALTVGLGCPMGAVRTE